MGMRQRREHRSNHRGSSKRYDEIGGKRHPRDKRFSLPPAALAPSSVAKKDGSQSMQVDHLDSFTSVPVVNIGMQ